MSTAKKINSFKSIINRLEDIAVFRDSMEIVNTCQTPTGTYPLIKIVLGNGNPRRVLISAGIHGDEPGGIEAILKFLKEDGYVPYINDLEITLLPCINPYGYEFGVRESYQGEDLNRLFKTKDPPLEVRFAQSILDIGFELTLELHEDNESHGYYLYQKGINSKNDGLGEKILKSLKGIMPINLDDEIDGSPAYQGIIEKELDIYTMDWWPMALYGFSKGTQMCLTLEAASGFDLETRVDAHLTAIKTVLNQYR